MTRDDVLDLLKVIAAYDRRTVGEADVLVWSEQARRGRWSRDAAFEAIHAHYAEATSMIGTADVNRSVRASRRTELERAYVPSQCADPELHRRIEAFANAKAVDAAPIVALPVAGEGERRGRGAHTLAEAVAKGERARAAHAATEAAGVESESA